MPSAASPSCSARRGGGEGWRETAALESTTHTHKHMRAHARTCTLCSAAAAAVFIARALVCIVANLARTWSALAAAIDAFACFKDVGAIAVAMLSA